MKTRGRKIAVALVVVAAMAIVTLTTALAEEDVEVVLTGGALTGGNITFADFTPVTLSGTADSTTADWQIGDIIDATGTGAGWNLSLELTQLKEYGDGAYVIDGHALAAESIAVDAAPEVGESGSGIAVIEEGEKLDTGSPVKLLVAEEGEGMGSFSFEDLTARLTIPADAYAGTYKADATIALSTGP